VLIDRLQMRNHLIVWHLKDWSLTDKDGKKVELTLDEEGALSDGSMEKVYALHTTVVDVAISILEKDLLLI